MNVDYPTIVSLTGIHIVNVEVGMKWIGVETIEKIKEKPTNILRVYRREQMSQIFKNGYSSLVEEALFTTTDFVKYSMILPMVVYQRKSDNRMCSLFEPIDPRNK